MPDPDQPDLLATYEGMRTSTYLGWERPLGESGADYLASGWSSGTLDLTGILVLVPTRQSGRKLRETLAAKISAGGGAVIPPIVTTPDALAAPDSTGVASPAEVLKAWVDTLTRIDLTTLPALFPVAPPDREFTWALHTAADFVGLLQDLGENGLRISDAANLLQRAGIEPDRWRDLARLESKVIARLRAVDLSDPYSSRRDTAASGKIMPGIQRVVLLGTPDPSPLALRILENYSRSIPVEVVIHAPDSLRDAFDTWGRPEKIQWNQRPIQIPNPDKCITIAATPRRQAIETTREISKFESPAGITAVGIGDPEVVPHLRQTLHGIGVGAFDPAGSPASEHAVVGLLRNLRDLLETGSITAFANVLHSADILDALQADGAETPDVPNQNFNPVRLLKKLDDLTNRHLPDNLDDLSEAISTYSEGVADIRFALERIRHWLGRFSEEDLGNVLPEFLGWAFSGREYRADRAEDTSTAEVARLVSGALDSMDEKIFSSQFKLGGKERLDLLIHLISSARITSDRRPDDIVLQGWLELLWEDAPQLILTGFNEGMVPESIVGDHYLPDTARNILGLRDNEERLARDAYLLTALIGSRKDGGRVEFLVGTSSQNGDPLRPSRLLFKCDREDLPRRALRLFGIPDSEEENIPARMFPWKLKPPPPTSPETQIEKISVTGFRTYLRCPFRFYLGNNLKMREVEVGKLEMNPGDFGTIIHEVLRRFAEDGEMRDCEDPKTIRDFLLENANWIAARRFGRDLPVPVLIQIEAAKQRLGWVADVQAQIRRDGWRIEHAEWKLGDDETPWTIDGFPISGVVDRIDRHSTTGTIRIIDYKTGKDVAPEKDHLGNLGAAELHGWEITDDKNGKPKHWTNLQLPLYVIAARELLNLAPEIPIESGYFHIPKARSGCGIDLWEDLDGPLLNDANSCAQGVIGQIRNHVYWPPREVNARYDDFSPVLFGDPAEAVDFSPFISSSR